MSERQQKRLELLTVFTGDMANLQKAVTNVNKNLASVLGFETKINAKRVANQKKTAEETQKIFDDPRYMGSKSTGFSTKEMDTYALGTDSIRARTSGLRHEVGKLRNILLLVAFATAGTVASFKEFFNAVVRAEASLNSLNSVAANTGLSFQKLKNYAIDLENTGIMSITGSVSAIKNLAATKISLNETIAVMKALTDAAAFNRQGTLSWEESVVGATQGIKNQNSIMIDNAGITKNVSIMYRDYALSLGKTVGKLSETEKRQAIVNGIISEAGIFAGDAERAMNTYQGRIAKFNTEIIKLQRNFGELIAPTVIQMLEKVSNFMSDTKGMNLVSGSIQLIVKYVNELLEIALKLGTVFEKIGNIIRIAFYPLFVIFDKLNLEFIGFFILLKKTGEYFNNLGTKIRTNATRDLYEGTKSNLLRSSAMASLGFQNIPKNMEKRFLLGNKINEQLTLEKEKTGTINDFITKNLNTRLKELAIRAKTDILAKNELMILREQAKLSGFMVATPRFATSKSTNIRITQPGEKAPKGFQFLPGSVPIASEAMRGSMSAFDKIRTTWTEMKMQFIIGSTQINSAFQLAFGGLIPIFRNIFATIKSHFQNLTLSIGTFFTQIKTLSLNIGTRIAAGFTIPPGYIQTMFPGIYNAFTRIGAVIGRIIGSSEKLGVAWNNLKLGALGISKAFITGFTAAISGALQLISTLMTVVVVYQWIKSFFDSAKEKELNYQKHLANLRLERKSREELIYLIDKEKNSIYGLNKLIGNDEFLNLTSKRGRTLGALLDESTTKQKELNFEFEKYDKMLKSRNKDEEELSRQLTKITDLRGELNQILNEGREITDSYNESVDKTTELFKSLATANAGFYSSIIEANYNLMEKLEENRSDFFNRMAQKIDTSSFSILNKDLKQSNVYYAIKEIISKEHQIKMEKIVFEGEKKLSDIQKQFRDERFKNIHASLLTELMTLQNSYRDQVESINRTIREISFEQMQSKLGKDVFNLGMKRMIIETKSDLAKIEGNIKTSFSAMEEYFKKFGLAGSTFAEQFKTNMENMVGSTYGALNFRWRELNESVKLQFVDSDQKSRLLEGAEFLNNLVAKEINILSKYRDTMTELAAHQGNEDKDIVFRKTKVDDLIKIATGFSEIRDMYVQLQNAISKNSNEDVQDYFLPGLKEKISQLEVFLGRSNEYKENIIAQANALERIGNATELTSDQQKIFNEYMKISEEQTEAYKNMLNEAFESLQRGMEEVSLKFADLRAASDRYNDTIQMNSKYSNVFSSEVKEINSLLKNQSAEFVNLNLSITRSQEKLSKAVRGSDEWDKLNKSIEATQVLLLGWKEVKKIEVFELIEQQTQKMKDSFFDADKAFKLFMVGRSRGLKDEYLDSFIDFENLLGARIELIKKANLLQYKQMDSLIKSSLNSLTELGYQERRKLIENLDKLREDLRIEKNLLNRELGQSFFSRLFNFPDMDLGEIEDKYEKAVTDLQRHMQSLSDRKSLENRFAFLGNYQDTKEFTNYIKGLDEQISLTGEQLNVIMEKYAVDRGKILLQYFNQLFSGVYEGVKNTASQLFTEIPQARQEKENMMKEQEELFRRGEISEMEHGRRVAEINNYYAKQVDSIWKKAATGVAVNILDMMAQVITSIAAAQAVAATKDVTGLLGILGEGFGAALPFLGIAAALGVGAAALASSTSTPTVPSFSGGENDTLSKFGGTIKAEDVILTISPTFIIEGDQVFIGSGSVVEYVDEATELMKKSIQQAIDNREIDLTSIRRA